jgi:hypothetical protein
MTPLIAVGLAALLAREVAAPAWCARAQQLTPDATFEQLASALPKDASPVVARARELAGEQDGPERARDVLRFAIIDACVESGDARSPEQLAVHAAALMNDPRFAGVRKGDGALDRVLHKIWLEIVALLESEGMRQYAGSARVIYLSVLALAAMLLAFVVVRALARQRRADSGSEASHGVIEAARQQAYAALRSEAQRLLAAGDARAALRAGDAALLARIGEIDDARARGALSPARTHREIASKLPAAIGDIVRAPFASFDTLFFGRPSLAADDARAFLIEVDAAERRLVQRSST